MKKTIKFKNNNHNHNHKKRKNTNKKQIKNSKMEKQILPKCIRDNKEIIDLIYIRNLYINHNYSFDFNELLDNYFNNNLEYIRLVPASNFEIVNTTNESTSFARYPIVYDTSNSCVIPLVLPIEEYIGTGTRGRIFSLKTILEGEFSNVAIKFQCHQSQEQKKTENISYCIPLENAPDISIEDEVKIQLYLSSSNIGIAPIIFNWSILQTKTIFSTKENPLTDIIIMQRLETTLIDKCRQDKSYIGNVAEIIQTMHDNGIAHCDLHSRNIMIDAKGKAFVIDFGKSKFIENCPLEHKIWYQLNDYHFLVRDLSSKFTLRNVLIEKAKEIMANSENENAGIDFTNFYGVNFKRVFN